MPFEYESEENLPPYRADFRTMDLRGRSVNVDQEGHVQLISKDDAVKQVKAMGQFLNYAYHEKEVVLIRIEQGANAFVSDMCREMPDVIAYEISVHAKTNTEGNVEVCEACFDGSLIQDRPVIIIDGLLRTGKTMLEVRKTVERHCSPDPFKQQIVLCTMCMTDLKGARPSCYPDLAAFLVDDGYIYGYGLHYRQTGRHHRNLRRVPRLELGHSFS